MHTLNTWVQMERKFPHSKLMNKSWVHIGNHFSKKVQIIPRITVSISSYFILHGKSLLFPPQPTHQVSLYANEGTTTSCPFLLATDRLFSHRSMFFFFTNGLLTVRDQWSWRNTWLLLLFFCQWESHMSHTWLCALTSPQHPPIRADPSPPPAHRHHGHRNFARNSKN